MSKPGLIAIVSFCLGALSLFGQTYPKGSLASGLVCGNAQIRGIDLYTSLIGLDLSHQANLSQVFDVRTNLTGNYTFPTGYYLQQTTSSNGNFLSSEKLIQFSNLQFNLTVAPMLYCRTERLNLFLGVGGGTGLQREMRRNFVSVGGVRGQELGGVDQTNFMVGWKSMIGISFPLSNSGSSDEIEISIFRDG